MSILYHHPRRGGKATKVKAHRLDVLNAIRARADAATPGPWEAVISEAFEYRWVVTPDEQEPLETVCDVGAPASPRAKEDAEFIANARADIPALLAHIDALEALIAALAEGIDEYWANFPEHQPIIEAVEAISGQTVYRTPSD